ncbi:MAG: acyl-[acyl-carrier-protein] thioesterase [Suipraeoptans sp.]
MKYKFNSKVRYSEVDTDNRLSIAGIVNYFQDCSTFQSEAIGSGVEYANQIKKGWILSSWQIIINERPVLGTEIQISTWAIKFKGLYGYRNFVLEDADGKVLAYAYSIWVYMDLEKKRPIRVSEDIVKGYGTDEPIEMEYAPRKIEIPDGFAAGDKFLVRKYQIDTNNHVNNSEYITIALEALKEKPNVKELRVEYRHSAIYGDCLYSAIAQEKDSTYIELKSKDEDIYAIIEIKE